MKKIVLKILAILLFSVMSMNIIVNISYAKYYITESLEAVNINIVL